MVCPVEGVGRTERQGDGRSQGGPLSYPTSAWEAALAAAADEHSETWLPQLDPGLP